MSKETSFFVIRLGIKGRDILYKLQQNDIQVMPNKDNREYVKYVLIMLQSRDDRAPESTKWHYSKSSRVASQAGEIKLAVDTPHRQSLSVSTTYPGNQSLPLPIFIPRPLPQGR